MRLARTVLAAGLIACSNQGSRPAPQAEAPAQPPVTAAPTDATASTPPFAVRVVGSGPPMILIPGLACAGDVWRGAEERFADRFQLHIVTLAGFAGQPAIEAPFLDTVRAGLVRYIDEHELAAPIVVGHSLGAMMALWVASSAPDQVGPVIALDGVPYGPGLGSADASPDSMRARATMLRERAASIEPEHAEAQARMMFGPMVTAEADLVHVLDGVLKSDPAAVGQAMYEMLTTDLRPLVGKIRTPVLMLVAGHHADDLTPYRNQLAAVPHHELDVVADARHFVMLDQPDAVYSRIDHFLAGARSR